MTSTPGPVPPLRESTAPLLAAAPASSAASGRASRRSGPPRAGPWPRSAGRSPRSSACGARPPPAACTGRRTRASRARTAISVESSCSGRRLPRDDGAASASRGDVIATGRRHARRRSTGGPPGRDAVAALLDAAGQPIPRIERPAGLTERETQVIGLLARGLQTKQVARALGISVKTADTHVQNAYRKIVIQRERPPRCSPWSTEAWPLENSRLASAGRAGGVATRSPAKRWESRWEPHGVQHTIARPVEDVFQYLLDLDQHPSDRGVESVVKTPTGPTGPGTTFRFTHANGRETSTRFTAVEPSRRIGFEGRVGPLRPVGAFTFAQTDGLTIQTVTVATGPFGRARRYPRAGPHRPARLGPQAREHQAALEDPVLDSVVSPAGSRPDRSRGSARCHPRSD